jgi:hypothetical protein
VLRPIPTAWGTISLVKATLYLLKVALRDKRVKKFVLVSETCIPVWSFESIYKKLIEGDGNKSRVQWCYGKNADRLNIISTAGYKLPIGLWAKQSQWMTLDRSHVQILFSRQDIHSFLQVFQNCPAADEHFFINFLLYVCKIPVDQFENTYTTYVDWNVRSEHPKLFLEIRKDLIDFARKNNCLFARKFDKINVSQQMVGYIIEQTSTVITEIEEEYHYVAKEVGIESLLPASLVQPIRETPTLHTTNISTIEESKLVIETPSMPPSQKLSKKAELLQICSNPDTFMKRICFMKDEEIDILYSLLHGGIGNIKLQQQEPIQPMITSMPVPLPPAIDPPPEHGNLIEFKDDLDNLGILYTVAETARVNAASSMDIPVVNSEDPF